MKKPIVSGKPRSLNSRVFWFDLGNVLLPFDFTPARRRLAPWAGTTPAGIRAFFKKNRWIETQSDTGDLTGFGLYLLLKREFGLEGLGFKGFCAIWNRIFSLDRGVAAILRRLKMRRHRLILISNTNRLHYDHIRKTYPIMKIFDHVILSYELGARKPDAAIYREALRLSGAGPGLIFYTDDRRQFIEAARSHHGVRVHLFRGAGGLRKAIRRWGVPI